jgi:hypothetical protein
MIFRRIKAQMAKEDWFAVFIDFIIVVFGVFMGFQVTSWNENRGDQREYKLALERLVEEAKANIVILDSVQVKTIDELNKASIGLKALRSCENSPENVKLIETGLVEITGTTTIHIQVDELEEMTSSPSHLAQQDPASRKIFKTAMFNFDVLKAEADYSEALPFRDRPETNPILGLNTKLENNTSGSGSYHGIKTARDTYSLTLDRPVAEACNDDQLLKSFYTWYRFQSAIPIYAAAMRTEMQNIIAAAEQNSEPNSEVTP